MDWFSFFSSGEGVWDLFFFFWLKVFLSEVCLNLQKYFSETLLETRILSRFWNEAKSRSRKTLEIRDVLHWPSGQCKPLEIRDVFAKSSLLLVVSFFAKMTCRQWYVRKGATMDPKTDPKSHPELHPFWVPRKYQNCWIPLCFHLKLCPKGVPFSVQNELGN